MRIFFTFYRLKIYRIVYMLMVCVESVFSNIIYIYVLIFEEGKSPLFLFKKMYIKIYFLAVCNISPISKPWYSSRIWFLIALNEILLVSMKNTNLHTLHINLTPGMMKYLRKNTSPTSIDITFALWIMQGIIFIGNSSMIYKMFTSNIDYRKEDCSEQC